MKRVLVLHSGGLDSSVCLYQAVQDGHEVVSLGINYGQTHILELDYARAQCKRLEVERNEIAVSWSKPARDRPTGRQLDEIRTGVSSAFLPGRNLVFLALATAHAAGTQSDEVWIGVNDRDSSGYPDCTSEFILSFSASSACAYPAGPTVVAPLQDMTKPEIAQLARELGLRRFDTWSCYSPLIANGAVHPCHVCDACVLHEYAWDVLPGE